MRFIERLGTVLRADAHGLVDNLEDHALLLKQALRDAQNAYDENCGVLDSLKARLEAKKTQFTRMVPELESLDADVDQALATGDTDLQKFVTRKFLRLKAQYQALQHDIEDLEKSVQERQQVVQGQERQLDDLKVRVGERIRQQTQNHDPESSVISAQDIDMEIVRRRGGGAA